MEIQHTFVTEIQCEIPHTKQLHQFFSANTEQFSEVCNRILIANILWLTAALLSSVEFQHTIATKIRCEILLDGAGQVSWKDPNMYGLRKKGELIGIRIKVSVDGADRVLLQRFNFKVS